MTKPIEGWVRVDADREVSRWTLNEDIESGKVPDGEAPLYYTELFFSLPKSDFGQVFRPVKITFTDEPSTEVVDEIRKDRERIYLELQPHIGEDSYFETDDGDREYSVPSDRCLRGIIFGEEK